MAAATESGAALLEHLRPEIERALSSAPTFGYLGFRVHFNDGQPVRIEYEGAVSRFIRDRPQGRGAT